MKLQIFVDRRELLLKCGGVSNGRDTMYFLQYK